MNKELQLPWTIIDKYFKDNPNALVKHHLDSYDIFFDSGIQRILKEKNPIRILKMQDETTKEFKLQCNLFLGGKEGNKIYYGKPMIYDDNNTHYMYPNEARLRNMTYGISVHYDVEVDFTIHLDGGEKQEHSITLEKIFLGRFPIMLMSNLCVLKHFVPQVRFNMGECRNDTGGYFIIDGKEKVIISQEKFADNMLYIRDKVNDLYSHSAEIRSVSEDASKPVRTLAVRIVSPTPTMNNGQIVVNVPNVRKPVPLFILMRALGIESDLDIIQYCLLDLKKNDTYVNLFIPSIHDAGMIFTQEVALKYIATLTKWKTIPNVLELLTNYFFPHMGEVNFKDKAYFLGYMVYKLLKVYLKEEKPTDRDSFRFKRIELPGTLLYDLFKEYYTLQQSNIFLKIDKEYFYHEGKYQKNFVSLIEENYKEFFKDRLVEEGFRKAFKGNWGAETHTKRLGVVQGLNRLSYNSYISHLRKINLPFDSSAKITGPRLLHSSQWGIIDPVDTPDGGNVGLHKHLAITALITNHCSGYPLIKWLRKNIQLLLLQECKSSFLGQVTKVFVNGAWIGVVTNPQDTELLMKRYRRNALIPIFTSFHWDIEANTIFIYTDAGRLCRPVYYMDEKTGVPSIHRKEILEKIDAEKFTWVDLITGFAEKSDKSFNYEKCKLYGKVSDLYAENELDALSASQAVIEYIDTAESESALIAIPGEDLKQKPYTHLEIHPSLILGVMGNQVVFPANNQLPRDLFACGQAKQAVSLYHSNYQTRIDKMGVVLNHGQIPLVKSRYMEYINHEQHPYGENVIAAIMCYGGYNVEDAILFNEGSIKRGLFRTTYFNMYETREESSKIGNTVLDSHFANIEKENVVGLKPGYDYSHLDDYGFIKENTYIDDKMVVIGKVTTNLSDPTSSIDASVMPKKGQLGYVDKTFVTEEDEGFRIGKVRIREEREPKIGDKFCSRCGQKGTIGLVIAEEDMPYTAEGIRPDIIINPHALPSRMTIGQLVETLMGKACAMYGGFGDCTAFVNKGQKTERFGDMLTEVGYHSSGNQLLYNGMTGEQMYSEIFIGPTYYMRLKHMVKDKINYRAQGPRTVLTRQTVQGRANDGGLRIGEMERDGLISHGMSAFLKESMLVRGDDYYMAICNQTGTIAIYNDSLNLFLSPMADGPIKFTGTIQEDLNIENMSKFGRSFSIVRVPYAFKLLFQELQSMNIQMRVITEDNIDQLTSMSFSNNIDLLLGEKVDNLKQISRISQDIKKEKNKQIEPLAKFKTPTSPSESDMPYDEDKLDEIQLEYDRQQYPGFSPGYSPQDQGPTGFSPGYSPQDQGPTGFSPGYSHQDQGPTGFSPGYSPPVSEDQKKYIYPESPPVGYKWINIASPNPVLIQEEKFTPLSDMAIIPPSPSPPPLPPQAIQVSSPVMQNNEGKIWYDPGPGSPTSPHWITPPEQGGLPEASMEDKSANINNIIDEAEEEQAGLSETLSLKDIGEKIEKIENLITEDKKKEFDEKKEKASQEGTKSILFDVDTKDSESKNS